MLGPSLHIGRLGLASRRKSAQALTRSTSPNAHRMLPCSKVTRSSQGVVMCPRPVHRRLLTLQE